MLLSRKYLGLLTLATWQDNADNTNVNGFKQFSSSSTRKYKHKNAKRNSGGIAVLVKNNIAKGISKLNSASEDIIWLKLDKEYLIIWIGLTCVHMLCLYYPH